MASIEPTRRGEGRPAMKPWFTINRADRDAIISKCGPSAVSVLAVWTALEDLSNSIGSPTFTVFRIKIFLLAGVSLATFKRAVASLTEIGLLTVQTNKASGTKELEASTYTLVRSAHKEPRGRVTMNLGRLRHQKKFEPVGKRLQENKEEGEASPPETIDEGTPKPPGYWLQEFRRQLVED